MFITIHVKDYTDFTFPVVLPRPRGIRQTARAGTERQSSLFSSGDIFRDVISEHCLKAF